MEELIVIAVMGAIVVVVALVVVVRSWILVPPNKLAVVTGGSNRLPDGSSVGYRVVSGGRFLVIPLLETIVRRSCCW